MAWNQLVRSAPALSPEDAAAHLAAYRIASRFAVDEWKQALTEVQDAERVRGVLVSMHKAMKAAAQLEADRAVVRIVLGAVL